MTEIFPNQEKKIDNESRKSRGPKQDELGMNFNY